MDERIVNVSVPAFVMQIIVEALRAHSEADDVPMKDTHVAAQVAKEFAMILESPFENKAQEMQSVDNAVKH